MQERDATVTHPIYTVCEKRYGHKVHFLLHHHTTNGFDLTQEAKRRWRNKELFCYTSQSREGNSITDASIGSCITTRTWVCSG